jgi:hypothetical protein
MNATILAQLYAKGDRNFQGFELSGVNLGWANLSGSNLRETNLCETNLSGACLKKADLSGGTDLSFADLSRADLSEANLRGANLEGANLEDANLRKALYDGQTKFPKGFYPSSSGAILYTQNTLELKDSENKLKQKDNSLIQEELENPKNNLTKLLEMLQKLENENSGLEDKIRKNSILINDLRSQISSFKDNSSLENFTQELHQNNQIIQKNIVRQYNTNPAELALSAQGVSEAEDSLYRRRRDPSIKEVLLQLQSNYSYWIITDSKGSFWLTPRVNLKVSPLKINTLAALFEFDYNHASYFHVTLQLLKPARVIKVSNTNQWTLIERGKVILTND